VNEPESPAVTPARIDGTGSSNGQLNPSRPPIRRPLIALGIGLILAALLAFVLYGGINHSSPQATTTGAVSPPPGLDTASVDLLDLSPVPSGSLAAPDFHLVDQNGRPTSLSQYRGKVVVWSLNDDQCTDLCALLAQDISTAEADLGQAAKDVVFVSVNANPYYPAPADVKAWSVRNDLQRFPNWVYVTGTPAQLEDTWNAYHVTVQLDQKDRTVTHDAALEFMDPGGHTRDIGFFSQGAVSTAFYAHAMAQVADDLLPAAQQVRVGGTAVNSSATRGATINSPAPGFDLQTLGGTGTTNLASLEGKPLVVNFWASTCSLCVQEMPALQEVDSDFKGQVNFVGVDVADPASSAAAFARRTGARYPLVADRDGTTSAAYRVDALPVTFVIAPDGTIVARHDGALTHDELVAVLEMDFQNLPEI
jgi:cytochrome oxidase Cu insertion factor (SCO1/SenC/PrrC family)